MTKFRHPIFLNGLGFLNGLENVRRPRFFFCWARKFFAQPGHFPKGFRNPKRFRNSKGAAIFFLPWARLIDAGTYINA